MHQTQPVCSLQVLKTAVAKYFLVGKGKKKTKQLFRGKVVEEGFDDNEDSLFGTLSHSYECSCI